MRVNSEAINLDGANIISCQPLNKTGFPDLIKRYSEPSTTRRITKIMFAALAFYRLHDRPNQRA